MVEGLSLIGFKHSVYTWIARYGLREMGLAYGYTEADPFAQDPDPALEAATRFGRVPILRHGEFTLSETAAILRYLEGLSDANLVPQSPQTAARMAQVIGIVDAYGYLPMVRDVFSHGFYRTHAGEPADPDRIVSGLTAATPVLQTLEQIAGEGLQLTPAAFSLADIHLAPMISYFAKVPAGARALAHYPALSAWWQAAAPRPHLMQTDPFPQH